MLMRGDESWSPDEFPEPRVDGGQLGISTPKTRPAEKKAKSRAEVAYQIWMDIAHDDPWALGLLAQAHLSQIGSGPGVLDNDLVEQKPGTKWPRQRTKLFGENGGGVHACMQAWHG